MKLNNDVYVLEILPPMGGTNPFNLSLLTDAVNGPTLVDCSVPYQIDAISAALAEAHIQVADIARIIVTHQDIDHIGSLHDLVQASGATVLASTVETPFIDGTAVPRFATPAALERRPQMRETIEKLQPTHVDVALEDGARLDFAGGVRIIFTPGHTPGHMCLYLERTKTLLAGDALTSEQGQLRGPFVSATMDMHQASQSVHKLAQLDVQTIVCYHGGVVHDDANTQLQHVAQELLHTN